MKPILVDVVMRSDYEHRWGGDVLQFQRYREAAAVDSNVDYRLLAASPHARFRDDAIVHIANVDRPWDFLQTVRQARGHRLIVSPIHHEHAAVSQIAPTIGGAKRRLVSRLPSTAQSLAGHLVRNGRLPRAGLLPPQAYVSESALYALVGALLDRADVVACLTAKEAADLRHDFCCRLPRVAMIPNGVDRAQGPAPLRDVDVLVPGRIEVRKNQALLAKALGEVGQPALFVGRPHPQDPYATAFLEALAEYPEHEYVPGLPHQDMQVLFRRAKIVVNASRVEVLSLVDLEAYAAGCKLITTSAGGTEEYLGDAGTYLPPSQTALFAVHARRAVSTWSKPKEPDQQVLERLSWPRVWDALHAVYRDLRPR